MRRALLALVVVLALAVFAAFAMPVVARRTIARAITTVAVHRGLSARWATLDVRFPSRVFLSRLRVTDAERGSLVFRAESLSIAIASPLGARPSWVSPTLAPAARWPARPTPTRWRRPRTLRIANIPRRCAARRRP